ncbi:MAG: translocation/assembly module TamB domain-containing protein [Desulfosarcina sp.]
MASLTGKLSAKGTGLRTDAVTIGNLEALLRLESGKLRVDRLDLQNQGSTLHATGDIQLLEPGSLHPVSDAVVDISARSDHFDPANFVEGASGDFNFNGVLKGSIEQPIGRITLSGRQAELAGQPIDSIALDARFEDRRLWLERLLAIVAPGEQIEAGGWVGLDQTADLKLRIDALSLTHVAHLPKTIPAKGVLSLDATARGSVQNPDVEGQLTVSNVQVNQKPIEDIDLSFSLHDMLAEVTGRLNFAIDAVYDLKKGDFDARLGFDETETAAYFAAAGQPDLHGTLSGRVQAAGNIRDPANSTAHMELSALHLIFKEISLVRSDRLVLDLAKGRLSIAQFDLDLLRSGRLNMTGGGQVGGNLDLTIDGRIPLAAASAFNDQMVDSVGSVVLAGRVTGDSADPLIDLRVDLDGIGMAVPVLAQRLHNLNGRVHLNKDQLRVEGLKGFLDTGSFSIDGAVMLNHLKPTQINLTVEAKSLPIEVPDTMSVLLNGVIRMTGKDRIARAGGEIVILEGVYYKDVKINLLQLATTRQRTVQPEKAPLSVPYFDRIDLDIKVNNRQPFLVQNNLAQLEVSPDLKIGGNLAQPVISGRALVNSGTVTFQKKRFEVKKGIIDFVDPYKTEAVVDIQSQTTIRDWTITLAIKGTPDNLDLTLSSVPSESDSDILSLILFGRTARELTAGEGGAKRSTGQIMAEMIADTFGGDVKKATGVDILQLETGGAGDGEDAADVKVTVGKHLSDRMTVKYAVETKDGETIQRAITEYKLLENILVSGFQDSQGTYGSELVFRIEFR